MKKIYFNNNFVKTIIIMAHIFFVQSSAIALEISPLTVELKTDENPSYQQILVRNTSNKDTAVEISISELIFNSENIKPLFSLQPVENDSDLLVFPPALILEPGQAKAIRVQWNSDKKLTSSKSYFIRFSQPQLSNPAMSVIEDNGVKIFVHFNAIVHISALHLQPHLSILNESLTINKQKKLLTVDVQNSGDSYQYLMPYQLSKFNSSIGKQTPLSETTSKAMNDLFFPPKSIRTVTIPVNDDWNNGDNLVINTELINGY